MPANPILWNPNEAKLQATAMYRFMREQGFENYDELYRWSIEDSPAFWQAVVDFCDVRFDSPFEQVLSRPGDIMHAGWFAGSTLNFAAHLMRHSGDRAALVFNGENGARRELSFDALRSEVAAVAAGLREAGVEA